MSTSSLSKGAFVKLYKQLQREAAKFPQYNYRVFAQRRIREHFEANRSVTDQQQLEALYKVKMRECVKCKSNEYSNKSLVMMVNECGHPLCRNCVDNLFARNVAPCHICGKTLRKNNFWEQVFDDPMIEKETHIRKRLRKIFNLKVEDFPSLREFNDYLEKVEDYVMNLVYDIDVEETEMQISSFKDSNADLIERNRKKLDADQLWIQSELKEEQSMRSRLHDIHNIENKQEDRSAVTETKAIMEELKNSDAPAELILDRERKRQIEAELEAKDEAAKKKQRMKDLMFERRKAAETMSFGTANRLAGRAFEYEPVDLPLNGPPLPSNETLELAGYLRHIRQPSLGRLAGGYTGHIGCMRALFESRIDLLSF